ncbi:MAG: AI-2E family transporter [Nocardioidaceae bacterium]
MRDVERVLPTGWRVTGEVAWRFLLVIAALGVVAYLVGYLAVVVVPVAVALLLAALLNPVVERLVRWRLPRAFAVVVTLVGGTVVIAGVLTGVASAVTANLPQLQAQLGQSVAQLDSWLANGPLHLSPHALQGLIGRAISAAKNHQATLISGAVSTVSTVAEALTAAALIIFTLIFFLKDGDAIWRFTTRAAPRSARSRVDGAGRAGFAGLIHYVRATILVAAGDAIGIGIGLVAVGVPLALPLAALVFLGAFIPIAGTVTAGVIAVLVTLVTSGLIPALIMLIVVVVVMQLEGNVLQPLLLGRAVRLHPLAVVLAITVGTVVAGIAGALLSVPLLTVVTSAVRHLHDADHGHGTSSPVHASSAGRDVDPVPETAGGERTVNSERLGKRCYDGDDAREVTGMTLLGVVPMLRSEPRSSRESPG